MKRRPLLQSPLQLNLFDFEPVPLSLPPPQTALPAPELSDKTAEKRRTLPGIYAIEYVLRRSRRRSIGFLIEDEGLRVTAPKWITISEIEDAIRSKLRWITGKLDERQQRMMRQQSAIIQWRNGASIAFLGKPITLQVIAIDRTSDAVFDNNLGILTLSLPLNSPEEKLKTCLQKWLQDEARRIFSQRLPFYAEKLGVTYQSFALSGASTQWGSCTANGRIRLNWRLIHLPLELIDYVVAHELSHLREMNHSSRFWDTVGIAFPDYKNARKSLRGHSPDAMPSS